MPPRLKLGPRFLSSRSGNFATMTALSAPVAFAAAALAIDIGALYVERRELQSLSDLAAIAAAADPASARQIVADVFADNGVPDAMVVIAGGPGEAESAAETVVEVELGAYTADPALSVGTRFTAGSQQINAVRLTTRRPGTLYFAGGWRAAPTIGVRSVASAEPRAAFSAGTRLARLDGGIANRLLSSLTGSSISLSVMDYEALIDADVDLFSFLDGLNAGLDLQAADYDELLASELTIGSLAAELARVEGLHLAAAVALGRLASASPSGMLALRQLIDLGPWSSRAPGAAGRALSPTVSAMELVAAAAMISAANGDSQLETRLGAIVPGLADIRLNLSIGEAPQGSGWLKLSSAGQVVRTSQTRMLLTAEIGGPGGILGSSIRLPLYLELAHAEARLAAIPCEGKVPRVRISARPGLATVRISDIDLHRLADHTRAVPLQPARLVTLPAVSVTGSAQLSVSSASHTTLSFSSAEIARGEIKRASTSGIATSLTGSLLGTLQLDVRLAGIDLGLGSLLKGTLGTTLAAAAPALDVALESVLGTLGVSLGEVDIRVHGAHCGVPALVQ